MKPLLFARMHGRGKMAAAPASDAATRGGRRCLRVEPRPVFFFLFFFVSGFAPTRADSAPTRAHSRRTGPIQSDSGRIGSYRPNTGVFRPEKGNRPAKKKKKVLKTENTNGFDTPLSPSSLALTPFFFFASSPSSSFFLASPAFQFLLFYKFCFVFFFFFLEKDC